MFKTFEEFLQTKSLNKDTFAEKSAEEKSALYAEYIKSLQSQMEEAYKLKPSNDEVDKAISKAIGEIKGFASTEEFKKLKKSMEDISEDLERVKTDGGSAEHKSLRESIKSTLIKNKEKIEAMKTDSAAKVQFVVKAPVAMTFGTNTTGNVGRVERQAGIVQTLNRTPTILDLVNVSTTSASVFEWIEKSGREGGVAMVAEGTVKPQGDWDLSLYSQKPKKEAIIVTVSKEMLDDIDGMAQDIEAEIYEQIRLFTEDITLAGDGTGNNIEGFDANATPFAAGSFADTVKAANNADCLRVAVNQVELNNDYPNYILMHPSDATAMELEKDDTTSQYILPPFTSKDGTQVKGIPVRTSTAVTQGQAYVGNFNRFKVKVRENITFDMGYRGAQGDWEKNMVSFLGEERLFAFIPQNHYGSIVKVDFSVAKALLDPAVA